MGTGGRRLWEVHRPSWRDERFGRTRPVSRRRLLALATLVDTSALYALVSGRDPNHRAAVEAVEKLRRSEVLTHNYVVVETTALVGRRLGANAVRDLHERILAAIPITWVDESAHSAAVSALLVSRGPSFVDLVSFELMRRLRIETAFAFDRDFAEQGFEVVP